MSDQRPQERGLARIPETLAPALQPDATQTTQVEQARAVAEVLGFMTAARQFPRDPSVVEAAVRRACSSLTLAERAFYSVPNRGTGESVHLARELARCYGHVSYGVHELRRDDERHVSEIRAFAVDYQTGVRQERTFQVPHAHMVGRGAEKRREALDDLMDVYRNNQSVGGRAVRECLFGVLPETLVALAANLCRETVKRGDDVPLDRRISTIVDMFQSQYGVGVPQLEARVRMPRDRWTPDHVVQLYVVHRSIGHGETTVEEEFPESVPSREEIGRQASRGRARRDGGGAVPPAASPPDPGDEHDPTTEPGWPGGQS